jgi:hypothetical protein
MKKHRFVTKVNHYNLHLPNTSSSKCDPFKFSSIKHYSTFYNLPYFEICIPQNFKLLLFTIGYSVEVKIVISLWLSISPC